MGSCVTLTIKYQIIYIATMNKLREITIIFAAIGFFGIVLAEDSNITNNTTQDITSTSENRNYNQNTNVNTNTNWNTKVILAEAENDVGTKNIVDEIDSFKEYEIQSNELNKKRTLRKVSEIETLLFQRMKYELESLKQDKDVKNIMSKVSKSDLEPEEAVNLIFKLFKKNF